MLIRFYKFSRLIQLSHQRSKNPLSLFQGASKDTSLTPSLLKRSFATGDMADDSILNQIPDIVIDHGRFKYILIKVYDPKSNEEKSKYIVRGNNEAAYHADIYEDVDKKLQAMGVECECVGGGRILHDIDKKCISVYGYSTGFGKADHAITTELLKKKYPDYSSISWSNEGY